MIKRKINLSMVLVSLGVLGILLYLSGCAANRAYTPDMPYWKDADRKDIPEPKERDPDLAWTSINRSVFDQAGQAFDVDRTFRILSGNRKESHNINSFDEVPNSTWFINRQGLFRMTPEEIYLGPVQGSGPDTASEWKVFRPKVTGATPGFWIEDSKGDKYIIKFDPPGHSEMATAAAAMASRYFHACGYNVPEETIVYWNPGKCTIRPEATIKDKSGVVRQLTMADLEEILGKVHVESDGTVRSLASKIIDGKIKGPFSYSGVRRDDPNDWCRHQNRRELRALYVIASFINHYDTKDQNTLDAYIEDNGSNYLKHYLIDFGSTFGADGDGPKPPKKGYANWVDVRDMFVSFVTLGLKVWPWENAKPYEYPSIGYFESEIFEPDKFDPIVPNPAFEEMTLRDAYWGAKIVMSFSDDDLKALVRAGHYSNPDAEAYLLKTLKERQAKIGRHWFSNVNPLDHFDYTTDNTGLHFDFDDLWTEYGFGSAADADYKYEVRHNNVSRIDYREFSGTEFSISSGDLATMASAYKSKPKGKPSENLFEVLIQTRRGSSLWSKPVALWLWYHPDKSEFQLVGIEHRSS